MGATRSSQTGSPSARLAATVAGFGGEIDEIVNWILGAGMFCVVNIHWDGGWIDSGHKEHFPTTYATFSPEAERKFRSYWEQIATFFAGKSEKLVFEGLNEETNFTNEGSTQKAYATLTRVNQLFVNTVRNTGGNNAKRLLIITGYSTDITKTCASATKLPTDTIPGRLFMSVHYYTPYQFCGLTEDADWGKMMLTWGTADNVKELEKLFDMMGAFCTRNDIPAFIGEFGVTAKKDPHSRIRWMSAVFNASITRKMVPVLWDTGGEVSRNHPYAATPELQQTLRNLAPPPTVSTPAVPTAPTNTSPPGSGACCPGRPWFQSPSGRSQTTDYGMTFRFDQSSFTSSALSGKRSHPQVAMRHRIQPPWEKIKWRPTAKPARKSSARHWTSGVDSPPGAAKSAKERSRRCHSSSTSR